MYFVVLVFVGVFVCFLSIRLFIRGMEASSDLSTCCFSTPEISVLSNC